MGTSIHQRFHRELVAQTGTRMNDWAVRTAPGINGVDATYIGPQSRYPGFDHAELKPFSSNGYETFNEQLDSWQAAGLIGDVQLWWYNQFGVIGSSGWNWGVP
jgi:hypothetical protein